MRFKELRKRLNESDGHDNYTTLRPAVGPFNPDGAIDTPETNISSLTGESLEKINAYLGAAFCKSYINPSTVLNHIQMKLAEFGLHFDYRQPPAKIGVGPTKTTNSTDDKNGPIDQVPEGVHEFPLTMYGGSYGRYPTDPGFEPYHSDGITRKTGTPLVLCVNVMRNENSTFTVKPYIKIGTGMPAYEETEVDGEQIDELRSSYTDELLNAIEKAYKKGGLRGVIKGDEQVSNTTVDEVLQDMKPLFGYDMEYAAKKIKKLLTPRDYAKYKTKMEAAKTYRDNPQIGKSRHSVSLLDEAILPSYKKAMNDLLDTVEKVYEKHGLAGHLPKMPKMGIYSEYTVAEFIEEMPSFFANDTPEEKRYMRNEIRGMLKPQEKAKYAKILESVQITEVVGMKDLGFKPTSQIAGTSLVGYLKGVTLNDLIVKFGPPKKVSGKSTVMWAMTNDRLTITIYDYESGGLDGHQKYNFHVGSFYNKYSVKESVRSAFRMMGLAFTATR